MGVGGTLVGFVLERQRHPRERVRRGGDSLPDDPEIEAALDDDSSELDTPEMTTLDAVEASAHDVGDLYGQHIARAVDTSHRDGDASFDEGQNWLEALETDAAEFGADPERPLDMTDEQDDVGHHSTDTRDIPVADRGAGGPGGL